MVQLTMKCGDCASEWSEDRAHVIVTRRSGGFIHCPDCDSTHSIAMWSAHKGRKPDNKKRSEAQEKRVAKKFGGKVQPASGSKRGAKADTRKFGVMRGECKLTRAKQFTLKLADLVKVENEATAGEEPAFFIEFCCQTPVKRYVVIPEWLYESYARMAGNV